MVLGVVDYVKLLIAVDVMMMMAVTIATMMMMRLDKEAWSAVEGGSFHASQIRHPGLFWHPVLVKCLSSRPCFISTEPTLVPPLLIAWLGWSRDAPKSPAMSALRAGPLLQLLFGRYYAILSDNSRRFG
jgi:hypothetical protein